ncbi:Spy/CpxP family protein refolding chaperone [Rhodoferax sp. BAB1]|uniref:Spy/CpxP family protein refolding chaperone n=1 Tax=Rhodoferax sp. BAB1 TaxID=2741720 RepID=UPI001576BF1D|nr:Spy/CpxP family protein refolding chaperone [Rhodoferax sp. BAB1]QKO20571.1 Spy/CpxP family protein refolding chaperone [Rhodoferax sp. BAB1]
MKPTTRKLLLAGLAVVSVFSAAAVIAGGPACDGHGGGRAGMSHGMSGQGPRHASFAPEERATRHLDELKSTLKLQAAQEGAWNAFAAAAQEQAKTMGKARDEMHGKQVQTTPERMDLARKLAREREQGMDKVAQAMKALYETLTPEQRKVLDQQHGGRMGGHRMHG